MRMPMKEMLIVIGLVVLGTLGVMQFNRWEEPRSSREWRELTGKSLVGYPHGG